ncbi:translation termination factor GTPase eRF3 [Gonapodya sp. JEL0774]|nr:translation termination factor GTPase eRF3 [Gonapodya sp. JEL0774]
MSGWNPNYNPNAHEFVPTWDADPQEINVNGQGQGQGGQHQYYQYPPQQQQYGYYPQQQYGYQQGGQGGYGAGAYGGQGGYGHQQAYPPNYHQNSFQQYQPAPRESRDVGMSSGYQQQQYGSAAPSSAPAPAPAPAAQKVSLGTGGARVVSLGGGASKAPAAAASETKTPTATETKAAEPKTDTPKTATAAKPATAPSTSSKPSANSSAGATSSSTTPASQPSAPKKKDEDFTVPENRKEHMNIVFIGHVDAGKSTMGGQLLILTNMVDKRTIEKLEKEAKDAGREGWWISWAMDLNPEERAQGKTIEYGRGYFETENRRFTILDAPGHKTYVPSMIAGAGQADVAVLVISARKGEFETGFERGGQTREHAMLVKTAGVKRLVVAINKMDDITVGWDKGRFDEIVGKLVPFLKQVGFNPKTDVDILPLSGFTGENMKDRLDPAKVSWYTGPSLIELLDTLKLPADRKVDGPFLMPVADKFKDMGTVVTGKIESGKIRKGSQLMIMPNRKPTEVMAIMEEEEEKQFAVAGDNVRIRLKNVEEEDALSGFVLCSPNNPVHTANTFECQLVIMDTKTIICAGYTAVLHMHTVVEEVSLKDLLHILDKKSGKKSKHPPKFLKQGDAAIVTIETTSGQAICAEPYAEHAQLGRLTLRDEGRTVAIGKVTRLVQTSSE